MRSQMFSTKRNLSRQQTFDSSEKMWMELYSRAVRCAYAPHDCRTDRYNEGAEHRDDAADVGCDWRCSSWCDRVRGSEGVPWVVCN
jgi:hypothetical protein